MKILNIISQRPEHTGSGVYLQSLIREATAAGHTGLLLAGVPANDHPHLDGLAPENCIYVEFEGKDLPFPVVGMSDTMPYRSSRFSELTAVDLQKYRAAFSVKVREAVNRFQPDIIHSHHLWIVTALVRELFPEIPMVASCHGTDLRQAVTCPHLAEPVMAACRKIDRITALGRIQAETIAEAYGIHEDRIAVAGGGYNSKLFWFRPREKTGTVNLLYAGKLSTAKGVPWLLKSLQRIRHLPWRLHLAGSSSGSEYAECVALAKDLEGRAFFHGLLGQADLAELMRKSHIFVLPSFFEGLPLVLLEALACGCRVVSTDLPGVLEIFQSVKSSDVTLLELPGLAGIDRPHKDDGPRLESDLAAALADQIEAALVTPDIDQARFDGILDHFTWQRVFCRIETLYRNIPKDPLGKTRYE